MDVRVTLEAECCCRPGPELGKVPIEKPRPIEIGDEPTRGRRALGDGVRRGCSQVVRASAGNRGPCRRLRSPDPAIQLSRKSDVVLDVTAARAITHGWCRLLSGEVPHQVEKPVPGPSGQVGDLARAVSAQGGARLLGDPVADHSTCCVAVEGPHEHRQCGERLPVAHVEQVMAPADDSPHREVSRVARADVTPQQVEWLAEACGELLHREGGDSGGSQLERQRKPVELADDGPHLVVVERSHGAHRSGAGHEHRAGRSVVEPAQVEDLFASRSQWLARGRKDPEVGTARQGARWPVPPLPRSRARRCRERAGRVAATDSRRRDPSRTRATRPTGVPEPQWWRHRRRQTHWRAPRTRPRPRLRMVPRRTRPRASSCPPHQARPVLRGGRP